jgi:AraC-like DNA-binding protein
MLFNFEYEKAADAKDYIKISKTSYMPEFNRLHVAHFHNSIELVFMTRGQCTLRINNEVRTLSEGNAAFIDSFDMHHYTQTRDCEYYVVIISSDFFDGENKLKNFAFSPFLPKTEGFDKILEFLRYSESLWAEAPPLFKFGFVNVLLGLMVKYYPLEGVKRNKQSEALISALRYINENCVTDITLDGIAAKFGYTPNYFSTVFNRFTGMSFREYLNRCRVVEFDRLRKEKPDISVCEAANLSGFSSLNTFYRSYKKYKKSNNKCII